VVIKARAALAWLYHNVLRWSNALGFKASVPYVGNLPNMKLGETIAFYRKKRGWSQNELARRAAVNHPTLHRIETGKSEDPAVSTVARIARALAVTVEDLLGTDVAGVSAITPAASSKGTRSEVAVRRALEGGSALADAIADVRKQLRQIVRRLEALESQPRKKSSR
jgi:transcriptional regulator with XRE-family HTH domain